MNPWFQQQYPQWESRKSKRSLLSGALSLILPGLGQLLSARTDAALYSFFLTIAGYLFFIPLGIVCHIICIMDAYLAGYERELSMNTNRFRFSLSHLVRLPVSAAILSLFVPGLGQMTSGRLLAGLTWMIGICFGYSLLVVPGIVLHILCVLDASITASDV